MSSAGHQSQGHPFGLPSLVFVVCTYREKSASGQMTWNGTYSFFSREPLQSHYYVWKGSTGTLLSLLVAELITRNLVDSAEGSVLSGVNHLLSLLSPNLSSVITLLCPVISNCSFISATSRNRGYSVRQFRQNRAVMGF